MRKAIRPLLGLLVLMLAATTTTACTRSTGGTAATGSVASISGPGSSTSTTTDGGPSTAIAPSGSSQETSSPPVATPAPTTAVTTTAVTTITVTSTPSPPIPPTDLSGEVYGFVKNVDVGKSEITLDKIDWFTGAAAARACAEDGITSTDNNRCTGYYYRNVNPALRVVAVSPQATISTLVNGVNPADSDLADVARRIATSGGESNTYRLVVTDGVVTDLREMYHP